MRTIEEQGGLLERMRQRCWCWEVGLKDLPVEVKGMILYPEQKLLHWLTREYYQGMGVVVELGSFVGSSTLNLANGLAARAARLGQGAAKILHSYDMFLTPNDAYTLKRLPDGYRPGDRFRDVYDTNTAPRRDWIVVHDGDLREDPWEGGAIEVLFLDICKCWTTNQFVLEQFFPSLIGGWSIVVQQDFVRPWNPWVPVTMAALDEYFEVIAEEEDSRVYLCTKAVPRDAVAGNFRETLSFARKRELMEASIAASSEKTAAIHSGGLALLVFMEGDAEEARGILSRARDRYGHIQAAVDIYANISNCMDTWKTGAAYERQMEEKF